MTITLRIRLLAVGVFFCALLLAVPAMTHAESVVWSSGNIPDIQGAGAGNWYHLYNTAVSVTYEAGAYEVGPSNSILAPIACGTTVPAGTRVGFVFRPHVYTDISWFATGHGYDSPYGSWSKDFGACAAGAQYIFNTDAGHKMSNYLVVDPPAKSVSGTPANCTESGSDRFCTLDTAGTFVASMTFAPTTGKFYTYEHYKGCREFNVPYVLQVPQQTATCPITVTAATGGAPSTPTLTSGGTCIIDTPHTVQMTATDPEGDKLRYGIDWNADGSIDEYKPGSGYVSSGTAETASRTYSIEGTKTVKVLAEDEGGGASDWTEFTFECTDPPRPAGSCSTSCGMLTSGSSGTFYLSSNPPAGQSCEPQTRTCSSGSLSGSHSACSCNTDDDDDGDLCSNIDGTQESAPLNSFVSGTQCFCDSGYDLEGDQCVPEDQCPIQHYCEGNNLRYRTGTMTGSICDSDPVETCEFGCAGASCLPQPPASGTLTATPSLVRHGETSNISWSTQNTRQSSCSVTENNPEINNSWSGASSATASGCTHPTGSTACRSGAIQFPTTYTLSCTGLNDQPFTKRVTVRVLPVESEPRH